MKDRTLIKKGVAAAKGGDFETALRECKPLTEQGYAPAQYNLGLMYADGNGVEQDYKTAIKWVLRCLHARVGIMPLHTHTHLCKLSSSHPPKQ